MTALKWLPREKRNKSPLLGDVAFKEEKLRTRLGDVAWTLWWHAERVSGNNGEFFETPEKTLAAVNAASAVDHTVTLRGLRKAWGRLATAGLVATKKRFNKVTTWKTGSGGWATKRIIYGRFVDAERGVVLLPTRVANWLNDEKRGGRRLGAGRKSAIKQGAGLEAQENQTGGRVNQTGGNVVILDQEYPIATSYEVAAQTVSAPPQPTNDNGSHVSLHLVASAEEPPKSTGMSTFTQSATLGTMFGGKGPPGGRPPPPGHGGVPRFPGPAVMPPATLPGPPRLPEGLSPEEQVDRCLLAYRGAFEARFKKRCFVLAKKGEARKSKFYPQLKAAAEKLVENDWSLGAWVLWSFACWADMGNRSPPPVKWVFMPSRMDEHDGWFSEEASAYSAPRLVYNDRHRRVLYAYQQMTFELVSAGSIPSKVRAVVEKWFPGDSFERWVREANAAAQDDQRHIDAMVKRGEWVWRS